MNKLKLYSSESDLILRLFLNFLVRDMEQNPDKIQPISCDLVSRVQSLVSEIDLDLDTLILDEDE